jgi:phosphoesterase RecJ-like protein
MEIDKSISDAILDELEKADRIALISHKSPDPDTIGSNFALRIVLEDHGKKVDTICVDENPYEFSFLQKQYKIIHELDPEDYDLIVALDCGSESQTHFLEKKVKTKVINIDHHATNSNYGDINLVIENAASTTIIMFRLFEMWKIKITPQIASCLLIGIYFDTGSFMHSNTDETVYSAAGRLIALGAKRENIINALYRKHTPEKFKLWGKILGNVRLTGNNVIVSGVQQKDFEECNATKHDLSGIIDFLGTAEDNRFTTLLCDEGDGIIKGSLRTRRDDINLSKIASQLGGGGHPKASGFSIKGQLKKVTHISIQRNT